LAEARTKTYGYRKKIFLVSTPKFAGTSRIEREYLASDQRRYHVPCPHCPHMQFPRFERLKWTKGQPETAAYFCEACGAAATEADKTDMLARGEWRPTAVAASPTSIGLRARTDRSRLAGFTYPKAWTPSR
jgi:phage terminase large subunit GpA-like protein